MSQYNSMSLVRLPSAMLIFFLWFFFLNLYIYFVDVRDEYLLDFSAKDLEVCLCACVCAMHEGGHLSRRSCSIFILAIFFILLNFYFYYLDVCNKCGYLWPIIKIQLPITKLRLILQLSRSWDRKSCFDGTDYNVAIAIYCIHLYIYR